MIHSERIHWLLLALLVGTSPAGAATNAPTLEELKAEGARQSIFKNQSAHAIETKAPQAALGRFREEIEPILKTHCVQCHGPEKAKAHLRIDTLDPNLLEGKDVDRVGQSIERNARY